MIDCSEQFSAVLGKLYETYLSTQFWNERTFWSDSYYVASIGNVSEGVILEYVRSQGM